MRVPVQGVYADGAGKIVKDGSATVYEYNTAAPSVPVTLATVYDEQTGGSAISASVITTDANGGYIFWVDTDDYNINQILSIILSKSTHADVPYHICVPGLQNVLRSIVLKLEPGATPGTNINVTNFNNSTRGYNGPTITDTTNLAKSGTGGSFSLDAGGTTLTMNLTEEIVGILSTTIEIHDLDSSAVDITKFWLPVSPISSGNLNISLIPLGASAGVDLTTILDAGDRADIHITFMTDS